MPRYYLKDQDDLYYNMVRVTEYNYDSWISFLDQDTALNGYQGSRAFRANIAFYDNIKTEVWVAFVTNKEFSPDIPLTKSKIEMIVSIATSDHSVFTTHMGIQRFKTEVKHSGISVSLHSFGAWVMSNKIHPEKEFMINVPTNIMADILLRAFEAKEMGNAIRIQYEAHWKSMLSKDLSWFRKKQDTLTIKDKAQIHLFEAVLAQEQDIALGKTIMPLGRSRYNDFVIHKPDGKDIVIDSALHQHEFAWFFQNRDQDPSHFAPMIVVEQRSLAGLDEHFAWDSLTIV